MTHRSRRLAPPLLVALLSLGGVGCGTLGLSDVQTVPRLELDRYAGMWYEIARSPNSFQKNLVGVTAEYQPIEGSDKVRVINRGHLGTLDGPIKSITGKAWVPDEERPGQLRVRFFWPLWAPYWVVALDEDYRWSAVSDPGRKNLWVLARQPQMDTSLYERIVADLASRGFAVERLEKTQQVE